MENKLKKIILFLVFCIFTSLASATDIFDIIENLDLKQNLSLTKIESSYLQNIELTFGEKTATKAIILTSPITSTESSNITEFLLLLAKHLQISESQESSDTKETNDTLVRIVLTRDDFSALPQDLAKDMPAGTNALFSSIDTSKPTAVILFEESKDDSITVTNGAKYEVSPLWLSEHLLKLSTQLPTKFSYNKMSLYRLGWMTSHPLLEKYLNNEISAILLQIGTECFNTHGIENIANIFAQTINSLEPLPSEKNDINYFILPFENKFFAIPEFTIIVIITVICACIFIGLGGIGFTFSKKTEQHLNDLKKTWYLVPIYLVATYFSLYIGTSYVLSLFEFRYGFNEAWTLMPFFSVSLKFIVAFTILSIITTLWQMIKLPTDSYIYGLIASLTCLINIFIFSSQDFSLSIIFIWVYFCSFVFYHCKSLPASILWALAMVIPFIPLLPVFASHDRTDINFFRTFFTSTTNWQIIISFFLFPIIMIIARFKALSGKIGRTINFRLPIFSILLIISLFSFTIYFFTRPLYKNTNSLEIRIEEQQEDDKRSLNIYSPFKLENILLSENKNTYFIPLKETESNYFGKIQIADQKEISESKIIIDTDQKRFLDRNIYTISIRPTNENKKPIRYDITISSEQGLAIFDANIDYDMTKGGSVCSFSTGEFPATPFSFEFSSNIDSKLTLEVKAFFSNKEKFKIQNNETNHKVSSFEVLKESILLGKTKK